MSSLSAEESSRVPPAVKTPDDGSSTAEQKAKSKKRTSPKKNKANKAKSIGDEVAGEGGVAAAAASTKLKLDVADVADISSDQVSTNNQTKELASKEGGENSNSKKEKKELVEEPSDMRSKLIAAMRSGNEASEKMFQECLDAIVSEGKVEVMLSQQKATPTKHKSKHRKGAQKSTKISDDSNVLAVAVEMKSQYFIQNLSKAGVQDGFARRGGSALCKAASLGSTELISSIMLCSPYNTAKQTVDQDVLAEIAHSFVSFLAIEKPDKTSVTEALTIGLLLKFASLPVLVGLEEKKHHHPIRRLLDAAADNVARGNYRLDKNQSCPSFVHLIVALEMPTLLYMVLAPFLSSTSSVPQLSQLHESSPTYTREAFLALYLRPMSKQGRPELSALQFAEARYLLDEKRVKKEQLNTAKNTKDEPMAAAEDGSEDDGSDTSDERGFGKGGKGKGKGKGKGRGKGKGKGRGRGRNYTPENNAPPELNHGAPWLCLLIVAEVCGTLECIDGSDCVRKEAVMFAVLAHFGIERVLSNLLNCQATQEGTEQVITTLDVIAEFKKLAQRDQALNLYDGTSVNWQHFVRFIDHKTSTVLPTQQPLTPSLPASSFESPKKKDRPADIEVPSSEEVDWAAAPFVSPQKPKKMQHPKVSSPRAVKTPPSLASPLSSASANQQDASTDHDDDYNVDHGVSVALSSNEVSWEEVFGQCGEVYQVQLQRVLRGFQAPSPHIVNFTEEELVRFQETDPISKTPSTRKCSISANSLQFLLNVLLSVGVHPVVLLSWVHIVQEVCSSFPTHKVSSSSPSSLQKDTINLGEEEDLPLTALGAWRSIIQFLAHMGTLLLYGVTGQCEDDNGVVQEEREKNIFDAILEMCFRLLPLHAPTIAAELNGSGGGGGGGVLPRSSLALVVNELSSELNILWSGLRAALSVIEGNCYLMPERFGTLLRGHFIWYSLASPSCEDIVKDINDACVAVPKVNKRKGHHTLASLFYSCIRTATTGTSAPGDKNNIFYGLAAANAGQLKGFDGMPLNDPATKLLNEPSVVTAINSLVLTEPNLLTEELGYVHRNPAKIIHIKPRLTHLRNYLHQASNNNNLSFTVVANRIQVSRQEQLKSVSTQFNQHKSDFIAKSEFDVMYEDEEGRGDGPIREFITSMGQAYFDTKPPARFPKEKPLPNVFPLFVRAPGDAMGRYVVPRAFEEAVEEKRNDENENAAASAINDKSEVGKDETAAATTTKEKETKEELPTVKKSMSKKMSRHQKELINESEASVHNNHFRTAGCLLAFSIKHNFPIGVALPPALWHEIMFSEFASWETYCLHDEAYRSGLEKLLSMDEKELEALDQRFVVTEFPQVAQQTSSSKKGGNSHYKGKNNKKKTTETKDADAGTNQDSADISTPPLVGSGSAQSKEIKNDADDSNNTKPSLVPKEVELVSGGKDMVVKTKKDALKFVQLAARRRLLRGCDVSSLRSGFQAIIPTRLLTSFTSEELSELVAGPNVVDVHQWKRLCIYDEELPATDPLVKMFWSVVSDDFNEAERRALLLFWSGSSVAPVFTHSSANTSSAHARGLVDADDNFLLSLLHRSEITAGQTDIWCPEASTCDKNLNIPRYTSRKAMAAALRVALKHGSIGYDRV